VSSNHRKPIHVDALKERPKPMLPTMKHNKNPKVFNCHNKRQTSNNETQTYPQQTVVIFRMIYKPTEQEKVSVTIEEQKKWQISTGYQQGIQPKPATNKSPN
jgi:hypothetical protein